MNFSAQPKISRRGLFRAGTRLLFGAAALSVGGYSWASEVEPDWLEITEHEIFLPHLARAFDGFRLVQLSDIHVESPSMRHDLARVCEIVVGLRADAVCFTGDFFTGEAQENSALWLQKGLARLREQKDVWAVLGNHDVGKTPNHLMKSKRAIIEAGPRLLENQIHIFRRGEATLHLAGSDDLWLGSPDIAGLATQIPMGAPAILLAHEPDLAIGSPGAERFGLVLCGHSHGGQICAPFGRVLRTVPGARKFTRGRYDFGGQTLYVHRGLGTVGPALRLFCRPEIAVFTLRSPA